MRPRRPSLERAYGRDYARADGEPVFISVHVGGGEQEIPEIMRFLDKDEVSFPVMLDAPPVSGMSWGATSKRYKVAQIPTDVHVAADGTVLSIGDRRIGHVPPHHHQGETTTTP